MNDNKGNPDPRLMTDRQLLIHIRMNWKYFKGGIRFGHNFREYCKAQKPYWDEQLQRRRQKEAYGSQ